MDRMQMQLGAYNTDLNQMQLFLSRKAALDAGHTLCSCVNDVCDKVTVKISLQQQRTLRKNSVLLNYLQLK